jgi:DUF1009 family protein
MKSLFLKIHHFLNLIFNRKYRLFTKVNRKVYKSIQDREVDRIILKGKIVKMVREYIDINTSSKFIPPWIKSNAEIKEEILHKYGEEMKQLGIKIYDNLKLSA